MIIYEFNRIKMATTIFSFVASFKKFVQFFIIGKQFLRPTITFMMLSLLQQILNDHSVMSRVVYLLCLYNQFIRWLYSKNHIAVHILFIYILLIRL